MTAFAPLTPKEMKFCRRFAIRIACGASLFAVAAVVLLSWVAGIKLERGPVLAMWAISGFVTGFVAFCKAYKLAHQAAVEIVRETR